MLLASKYIKCIALNQNDATSLTQTLKDQNVSNLAEAISQMIEHHSYPEIALNISQTLSLETAIEWCRWTIEQYGELSTTRISAQYQDAHSPNVWLDAAVFWKNQLDLTHEYYLEELAREAIYGAIALMAQQNLSTVGSFESILAKGLELLNA